MHNHPYVIRELTAEIVAAYVGNSSVPHTDVAVLIDTVHRALSALTAAPSIAAPKRKLVPAVAIRKSVTPDYIVCLEDGKLFKSLRRHLFTRYNLTPEAYRAKWGLPGDYPMLSPNYAAKRSELAQSGRPHPA